MKIDDKEIKELFNGLRKQNKDAFEMLYLKYNKLVYGIAFSILKNNEYSEDMVQNVFMKIYEMEKSKLPTCMEKSWLYTLTKNETISYIRNKKNNVSLEEIYEIEEKNDDIEKIISKEAYNKIICKLSSIEKEIVSLKILSSFSFDEISKMLELNVSTVKWKYYKALNSLKILLGNIGAFVVTFVIGITTLFKKEKTINNSNNSDNIDNSTSKKEDLEQSSKDEIFKSDEEKEEILNNTKEEIILEKSSINYIGISFLCIFSVFFAIIINFVINFLKCQLKFRKKASK